MMDLATIAILILSVGFIVTFSFASYQILSIDND